MYWLLRPWRHAFDFRGRSPRREYWLFVLQFYVVILVPVLVLAFGGDQRGAMPEGVLRGLATFALIVFVVSAIPGIAVGVRRLHDHNKSGALLLLGLIPAVGGFILLFLMVLDGDEEENDFGPNPRDRDGMAGVSEVFD